MRAGEALVLEFLLVCPLGFNQAHVLDWATEKTDRGLLKNKKQNNSAVFTWTFNLIKDLEERRRKKSRRGLLLLLFFARFFF
jgi:hypothetical protein